MKHYRTYITTAGVCLIAIGAFIVKIVSNDGQTSIRPAANAAPLAAAPVPAQPSNTVDTASKTSAGESFLAAISVQPAGAPAQPVDMPVFYETGWQSYDDYTWTGSPDNVVGQSSTSGSTVYFSAEGSTSGSTSSASSASSGISAGSVDSSGISGAASGSSGGSAGGSSSGSGGSSSSDTSQTAGDSSADTSSSGSTTTSGSGGAVSSSLWDTSAQVPDSLNYYQVRYGRNMGIPLPEGKVEFFILGSDSDYGYNIPYYIYLMLPQTLDNIKVSRSMENLYYRYVTTLTTSEINELFNQYGEDAFGRTKYLIRLSILQKADIEKIYHQMSIVDRNMPKLGEINYGIKLNAQMEPIVDFENSCIPDSDISDYRLGRTIVLPECYNALEKQGFFYNFNNPAVREYCVRVAIKTKQLYDTKLIYTPNIFLDNYGVIGCLQNSIEKGLFQEGDKSANIRQYANQLAAVCKEIKDRTSGQIRIIANCFLPRNTTEEKTFLETLTADNNIVGFDGFMAESIYGEYGYRKDLVEWFVSWAEYLDRHGVKLLLCPERDYLTPYKNCKWAWNFHLFSLLISRDNIYVWYSNTLDQPMIDYDARDILLGSPYDSRPTFKDKRWYRQFQFGTIVLDTTKSGWDGIRLERKD